MNRSWGYGSDRRNRHDNQDRLGVFELPQCTLAIVCDGMGGHVGGASAATLAIRVVYEYMRSNPGYPVGDALREALERANTEVYEAARKDHRLMGMGTTAVVAALTDDAVVIAHVGDSRAYLIRAGQAKVATRDHTMVNLFVDAELLTPEDAATHPEAHVLSRSIGTERQVDVEVSQPVRLVEGDVVLLCSDGVHGVVADFELNDVDWSVPHDAVRELLEVVALREGDDNASSVALRFGAPLAANPPETPLPSADQVEDEIPGAGSAHITDHRDDSNSLDESVDIPGGKPMSDGALPQYVVFEELEAAAPARPADALREKARTTTTPAERTATASRGPLVFGALALALVLASAGVYWKVARDGRADLSARIEKARTAEEIAAPRATPNVAVEASAPTFFRAEVPEPPKRPKHRATVYLDGSPRSREQILAMQEARGRACANALDAVDAGMAYSPDHAALYEHAWSCFDTTHARPLLQATLDDPAGLAPLIVHLEGDPAVRPLPEGVERFPAWARPPVDGLEYRLEAYIQPERGERMAAILADRVGKGPIADAIGGDLALETQVAAALAGAPALTPEQQGWWARRVFVASRMLASPAWPLVQQQRPDLATLILAAFEAATRPVDESGVARALPAEVAAALEAGRTGTRPAPRTVRPVAPRAPREPTDEDLAGP